MLCKNWVIPSINKDLITEISEKLEIDPFLAMMLQVRGITTEEDVVEFLNSERNFSDPMTFIDMDKAVQRINFAVDKFEKICVYGDYDSDGVTSIALLYSYLSMRGANVIYFAPDRNEDGYGLNISVIEKLRNEDVKLIVTVDNGVAAYNEVEFANDLGIDVVITDHHKVPEKIPNAIAVVDPHRCDCPSQFKDLAGVGVAFKLVCALEGKNSSIEDLILEYGDLIAVGTVGDVVPLKGENRDLVNEGIKYFSERDRIGLKHLLELSGMWGKEITSTGLAFSVVPRINASGRMSSPDMAVKLLLSENDDEARSLAVSLNDLNFERKKIESKIMLQVDDFLEKNPVRLISKVIVVEGEGWHTGVIGIVASRIVEKYAKPCIVISKDGDVSRGSGRSIEGFSLYDAVNVSKDHLIKFGGHPMAVGFDIATDKIEILVKNTNVFAQNITEMPVANLKLDCKLRPESMSAKIVDQLKLLEPFGCENSAPLFGLFRMKLEKIYPVSGGKHLRLSFSRDDVNITAMKFSTTMDELGFSVGDVVDLAVTLSKDFFRDVEQLSIFIRDIKISGVSREDTILNAMLYESILRSESIEDQQIEDVVPTREEFAVVYRYIKSHGGWNFSLELLGYRLKCPTINLCKLDLILDIMQEVGLISVKRQSTHYSILLNSINGKVNLDSSLVLKKLKLMGGRET